MSLGPSNPYAAPELDTELSPLGSVSRATRAERTRQEYLSHETSVRSIGWLYYLGAVLFGLGAIGMVCIALFEDGTELAAILATGVFEGGLAILFFAVGSGLRRLVGWVRVPVGIISVVGLLGVPLGTIVNGYILWLIFSEKGQVVFSPEYREVIRLTPHIRYKTSFLVLVLLGLVIVLLILGAAVFLFG